MSVRVIVNADDLGMSEEVNAAIFELIALGRVTSSTVLANAPAAEGALSRLAGTEGASFGVHLNATQFSPLTGSPGLAPLLDEQGAFAGDIRSAKLDRSLREAVGAEWEAQVERVRAAGVRPSHLDSHHHVHTLPELLPVLLDLRKRTRITRVRPTRLHYGTAPKPKLAVRAKKRAWNLALRTGGARSVDLLTDLRSFVERPQAQPGQLVELMVHPGSTEHREEEELLRSEWWTGLPFEVELVSYAAL